MGFGNNNDNTQNFEPEFNPGQEGQSSDKKLSTKEVLAKLGGIGTQTIGSGDSEEVAKFVENFAEAEKTTEIKSTGIKLFYRKDATLDLPLLAIYARRRDQAGKEKIFYYSILSPKMGKGELKPFQANVQNSLLGNRQATVYHPMSMAFNETYRSTMAKHIAAVEQVEAENVQATQRYVMSSLKNLGDKEVMYDCINTALRAFSESSTGPEIINLHQLCKDGIAIEAETEICAGTVFEPVENEPRAADAMVRLRLSLGNQNNNNQAPTYHSAQRAVSLVEASVKFETIRHPVALTQEQLSEVARFGAQIEPQNHKVLAITGMSGVDKVSGNNTEGSLTPLMAMIAAVPLQTGANVESIFRAPVREGGSLPPINALAALYEPVVGAQYNPHVPKLNFSEQVTNGADEVNFSKFFQAYFVPLQMNCAIDVPRWGQSTWFTTSILNSTNRDHDMGKAANDKIIAWFDAMLDNKFSVALRKRSGLDKPWVFMADTVVINDGFYYESKSQGVVDKSKVRPAMEIDTLRVLSELVGEKGERLQTFGPEHIESLGFFEAAYIPGAHRGNNGLILNDLRRSVLTNLVPSIQLEDFTVRVFYSPYTLPALVDALVDSGIRINNTGLVEQNTLQTLSEGFIAGQQPSWNLAAQAFSGAINNFQNNGWGNNFANYSQQAQFTGQTGFANTNY